MASRKKKLPFDPKAFLSKVGGDEPFPNIGRIKLFTDRAILRIPFFIFGQAEPRSL